jgi:hypothetical protein
VATLNNSMGHQEIGSCDIRMKEWSGISIQNWVGHQFQKGIEATGTMTKRE